MGMDRGNNREIVFKDQEHEMFYRSCLPECRQQDVYHKALVYCLGISGDTRRNVERIFDFKKGSVKPRCLEECQRYTVEDLFCCEYAVYFWEAVKVRYPEYCFPVDLSEFGF